MLQSSSKHAACEEETHMRIMTKQTRSHFKKTWIITWFLSNYELQSFEDFDEKIPDAFCSYSNRWADGERNCGNSREKKKTQQRIGQDVGGQEETKTEYLEGVCTP